MTLAHVYSEFTLDLPPQWQPQPNTEDNTLSFHDSTADAALIVSVDFIQTPPDQLQTMAEHVIARRIAAMSTAGTAPVQVLQQQIRPHTNGKALELSFIAEAANEHLQLCLGYVSARKIMHFAMFCAPDRAAAVALFNATVSHFKPRLP
ncbi:MULTISPECIES: hypothetical protein [unclassified Roseateles]|uniref:hypothetical protein n=1 Tax=unclassified Roseateles TaxID=2626991 RepID=UPI0012E3B076|nr:MULTISPECIES: hypothetical protein [unclassified Roseateles]